jgi:hypothetical protein
LACALSGRFWVESSISSFLELIIWEALNDVTSIGHIIIKMRVPLPSQGKRLRQGERVKLGPGFWHAQLQC